MGGRGGRRGWAGRSRREAGKERWRAKEVSSRGAWRAAGWWGGRVALLALLFPSPQQQRGGQPVVVVVVAVVPVLVTVSLPSFPFPSSSTSLSLSSLIWTGWSWKPKEPGGHGQHKGVGVGEHWGQREFRADPAVVHGRNEVRGSLGLGCVEKTEELEGGTVERVRSALWVCSGPTRA